MTAGPGRKLAALALCGALLAPAVAGAEVPPPLANDLAQAARAAKEGGDTALAVQYNEAQRQTALGYAWQIAKGMAAYTWGDVSRIASDLTGRFGGVIESVIEDGFQAAVREAYRSTFKVLVSNEIEARLGYTCSEIQADLLALVLPGVDRAFAERLLGDPSSGLDLGTLRGVFTAAARERFVELLSRKLEGLSAAAVKLLAGEGGAAFVKRVAGTAASLVEPLQIFGEVFQKLYFYQTQIDQVRTELGMYAAMQARYRELGTPLSCADLHRAVRQGWAPEAAVAGAQGGAAPDVSEGTGEGSAEADAPVVPLNDILAAHLPYAHTVPPAVDGWLRGHHPEYAAVHAEASRIHRLLASGRRPACAEIEPLLALQQKLAKAVMDGWDDKNPVTIEASNTTSAMSIAVGTWGDGCAR